MNGWLRWIVVGGLLASPLRGPLAAEETKAPPSSPTIPMTMMPEMPEKSFLMPSLPASAQYVAGVDEKYPRLRYPDGQISLNDRCPVRHVKLNPKMAPVYVNGKPIGFC